jgi:hypothetical protein
MRYTKTGETLQRIRAEVEEGIETALDFKLDVSLIVAKPHDAGPPGSCGSDGTSQGQTIQLGYDGL